MQGARHEGLWVGKIMAMIWWQSNIWFQCILTWFKWKHMKGWFLSLLPQVIPWFSISWIFFLVIHGSFALGQPTDMMNLTCSTQYGYKQALAVPQVTNTHCGLRHCCHLLVLAWEKKQDLAIFLFWLFQLFQWFWDNVLWRTIGTLSLERIWPPGCQEDLWNQCGLQCVLKAFLYPCRYSSNTTSGTRHYGGQWFKIFRSHPNRGCVKASTNMVLPWTYTC